MTPIEELRAAAAKLRETAADTTEGPWRFVPDLYWDRNAIASESPNVTGWDRLVMDVHNDSEIPAVNWIVLVHPGLAEPLAAWLDEYARVAEVFGTRVESYALATARVINGGDR